VWVEYAAPQGRNCGIDRGSSDGDLLCRYSDLRCLGRCEVLLRSLSLVSESGVCVLLYFQKLENVGDGVGVLICVCVGSGKIPWLWCLCLIADQRRRDRRRGFWLYHLYSTHDSIFFSMSSSDFV
jgi:hypothetical protein